MPEYIDRDKLYRHFENDVTKNEVTINGQKNLAYLCDHVLHEIRNAPTADVVEVRHGEWIPIPEYENKRCSVCSAVFSDFTLGYYCPKCGAKMDGKDK